MVYHLYLKPQWEDNVYNCDWDLSLFLIYIRVCVCVYFCVDSDPEYTADRNTVVLTGFSEQMLRSNVLLLVPVHIDVVELPAS